MSQFKYIVYNVFTAWFHETLLTSGKVFTFFNCFKNHFLEILTSVGFSIIIRILFINGTPAWGGHLSKSWPVVHWTHICYGYLYVHVWAVVITYLQRQINIFCLIKSSLQRALVLTTGCETLFLISLGEETSRTWKSSVTSSHIRCVGMGQTSHESVFVSPEVCATLYSPNMWSKMYWAFKKMYWTPFLKKKKNFSAVIEFKMK